MNIERLLLLATKLETLKSPIGFDLSNWGDRGIIHEDFVKFKTFGKLLGAVSAIRVKKKAANEPNCGYSACAVGHAGMMPEFQKLGFALVTGESQHKLVPHYDGLTEWEAVESFFDLTEKQAEKLFMPDSYGEDVTAADVAKRIRKMIKKAA